MEKKLENKFYTVTGVPGIPDGDYALNPVTDEAWSFKQNKILKGSIKNNHIYIHFQKGKNIAVHKLMASFFLGIPDDPKRNEIHHKNFNPYDNRPENLMWVTSQEHRALHKGQKLSRPYLYYEKLDDQGNVIERIYSDKIEDEKRKKRIQNAASHGFRTEGFYWQRGDELVDKHIEMYGMPKDADWYPCYGCPGRLCTKNGLFKDTNGRMTVGSIATDGYYRINIKVKEGTKTKQASIKASRVIWNTFNPDQLLGEDDQIDHRDGNKENNCLSNLRKTDGKGNMNNPITRAKLKKINRDNARNVEQYTLSGELIKTYSCLTEAAEENRLNFSCISRCCSNSRGRSTSGGCLWCFVGDSDKIKKDQKNLLFKYDQSGNLLKVYFGSTDAERDTTISKWTIAKYTKSGKLAPDNYYYHKGPKENFSKTIQHG